MPEQAAPIIGHLHSYETLGTLDGPGLRLVVFLQGCPLRCLFCHNPDTWDMTAGRTVTVEAIVTKARRMRPYFGSTGGITLSGGEPLAQPDFLEALLAACVRLGVHRAVDTSGFATAETALRIARHTDLFLFDLKHMDPAAHRRATGVDNAPILTNLRLLAETGARVQLRLPLIPGFNDGDENIRRTGLLAASLPGVGGIDVLPYHATAKGKYAKLGLPYPGADIPAAAPQRTERAAEILRNGGLTVRIGG